MSSIIVNAMGDQCPVPVVKTMKAIAAMTQPGTLEVHVDYEVPVQNLTKFAAGRGLPVSSEKLEDKHYVVKITVEDPAAAAAAGETSPGCIPDLRGDTVIAIGSECMGNGDDKLGATLMKGFLYAVSQQEELPRAILFYNSGAKLTTIISVELRIGMRTSREALNTSSMIGTRSASGSARFWRMCL